MQQTNGRVRPTGGGGGRGSRSWWTPGPPIGSALGGSEPEQPQEELTRTLSERWADWKKQTRATLAGVPRALSARLEHP